MNLQEVNEMFSELKKEVSEIANLQPSFYSVKINNCKSSLGRCRKYGYGMYQVELSKYTLNCDKELIKNILLHEIIHLIPNCFNHGRNFLYYMYLINRKLGTNIEVRNTNKEFGSQIQYKYKITCKKCKSVFYRHKLPKNKTVLKHASDNGDLIIEQLY